MANLDDETLDNDLDFETDTSYEDETETPDEITYEQAIEWKKKAERLEKAERKLVDLKKRVKNKPETKTESISEKDIELREELSEFLLENKDLKDYKTDLLKYRKQGFTIKQAVALVETDDKTIENRKKSNSLNITTSEEPGKTTYTKADLENMSQSEYNKIMSLKESGKIAIKK